MKMTSIERIEESQMIKGENLIKSSKVFKWENVKPAGQQLVLPKSTMLGTNSVLLATPIGASSFAWMLAYKYAMHPNLKVHHKREEEESKKGKVIP
jgi:hypothetical protein